VNLLDASANQLKKQDADLIYKTAIKWEQLSTDITSTAQHMLEVHGDTQCLMNLSHEVQSTVWSLAYLQFLTRISATVTHDDDEHIALFYTKQAIDIEQGKFVGKRQIVSGFAGVCHDEPVTAIKAQKILDLLDETARALRQVSAQINFGR